MKEINNLTYGVQIGYVNKLGEDVAIAVEMHDNGLVINSVQIGSVCVTEETIGGRVLSGRFENEEGFCGYRYDYENFGEELFNINPDVPLNTAISLINKTKMGSSVMSAKMILSSILRNDYRVVSFPEGSLNITKTISAENETAENCCFQENIVLSKQRGEDSCVEEYKETIYKVGDKVVTEEAQISDDNNANQTFADLIKIYNQNPKNYKELSSLKNQVEFAEQTAIASGVEPTVLQ